MRPATSGPATPASWVHADLQLFPRDSSVVGVIVAATEVGGVERDLAQIPPEPVELECNGVDLGSCVLGVHVADPGVLVDEHPEVAFGWREQCRVPIDEDNTIASVDGVAAVRFAVRENPSIFASGELVDEPVVVREHVVQRVAMLV